MKLVLHEIAYRIGRHPSELARAIQAGDVTGEVPSGNPQSKEAWVDGLSLRNYFDWLREQGKWDEQTYRKAIRHLDRMMGRSR
jgi:ribosomal protein L19E